MAKSSAIAFLISFPVRAWIPEIRR